MGKSTSALEETDELIGRNIRLQRLIKGVSRAVLAAEISVSAQQLRKYETGENRVSASRLFHISQVLGVSIGAFFDGLRL